jgi:general secretion pathway protein B
MSFILDALKKSETDRQRQASPALFEVKVAAPRRRFPVWAIALGALLVANGAVLAWVLMRQSGNAPRAEPTAPATAQAPAAAAAAPMNVSPSGEVTVPATVTFQVNVPANAAPAAPVGAEPGVIAPSAAPPLAEEPLLSGAQTPVPPDYDANDYRPAITESQAASIAAARRAGGDVPSRDQVLAQGAALPDLRLDLHVYDPDPAKRFVFVNMRKLREGESLPEGARVEEILQQGVRLSYRGQQFVLGGN